MDRLFNINEIKKTSKFCGKITWLAKELLPSIDNQKKNGNENQNWPNV